MNDDRLADVLFSDILLAEHHVRAGLTGEGKAAVAVGAERHKRHRRHGIGAERGAQGAHMVFFQRLHQEAAEVILANAAAHTDGQTVSRRSNRHIGGRAACLADVACRFTAGNKINDHLTDAEKIHLRSPLLTSLLV